MIMVYGRARARLRARVIARLKLSLFYTGSLDVLWLTAGDFNYSKHS